MKLTNQYAELLPGYDETPKAVYAAIALSLALRLSEENLTDAICQVFEEWITLHQNDIVPQSPAIKTLTAIGYFEPDIPATA